MSDGEPIRRRAAREEFSDEQWHLVGELANYPNRLLVTVTNDKGETYAEVSHEAIFRRWNKLKEWIAAEREFLAWRSGLEAARRAWQATPDASRNEALLMGASATQAANWLARRANEIPKTDREFILFSIRAEKRDKWLSTVFIWASTALCFFVIILLIALLMGPGVDATLSVVTITWMVIIVVGGGLTLFRLVKMLALNLTKIGKLTLKALGFYRLLLLSVFIMVTLFLLYI